MSALAAVFFIWVSYTNLTVGLTRYNLKFKSLPQAFEGFKIAQISDYHNTSNENFDVSISVDMLRIKEEIPPPNPLIICNTLVFVFTSFIFIHSLTYQVLNNLSVASIFSGAAACIFPHLTGHIPF